MTVPAVDRLAGWARTVPARARAWLTPVRALRLLAVIAPLALLSIPLVRGLDGPDIPHYERPDGPTPTVPALAGGPVPISLPGVEGTTTTEPPPATGAASLSGTVVGPQGAVPGAVVRVERVVGDVVLPTDVVTLVDGTWSLTGVPGGRYRIRAFLAPTLAQTEPTILFVEGDEQARADLTVEAFGTPQVVAAVAPDPPVVDELVNVTVQLVQGAVDPAGLVTYHPMVGWTVELQSAGTWVNRSVPAMFADTAGRATFTFECRSAGPNQLQFLLRSLLAPAVVPVTASVPDCVAAPVSEPTSSTAPGAPSTGSSTSSSTTTTER